MSAARIGPTDAAALLRALGYEVRGWLEYYGDHGVDVLAAYVETPDAAWRLAREVGGILPEPRWSQCGPWWIAYWPTLAYAGDDADPECVGIHAT